MIKKITNYIFYTALLYPALASAQFEKTQGFLGSIYEIINSLVPIVGSLAFFIFLWGLAKFIFKLGGDAKAVEEGKRLMVWGLIALFVLVSVWGIIGFISGELGIQSESMPGAPVIPKP